MASRLPQGAAPRKNQRSRAVVPDQPPVDPALAQRIGQALLRWYQRHQRTLPWRNSGDPYAVWVSEVMLQQTQVATVMPYFARWMRRFPDVRALALASEDSVLQEWQGLGYYSRARSLRRGAQHVVEQHSGHIPSSTEELRRLPGVGPYTAGAIASIAFGRDEPIVDGNVTRVLTRLFALAGDPAREPLKSQLWKMARQLIVKDQAADFNQALMELGALCCTPRQPLCLQCPVRAECRANAMDQQQRFPESAKRPKPTLVNEIAALARRAGRVLLVRRAPDAERWASLWQFPSVTRNSGESNEHAACRALQSWTGLSGKALECQHELQHSITRYRIHLALYQVEPARGEARAQAGTRVRWCTTREIEQLALPSPHRKLAAALARR